MKKLWFIALVALGCDNRELIAPETTSAYFMVSVGQYWVYQVEEIRYSLLGVQEEAYELRETVSDTLIGADTTYVVWRERRADESSEWKPDSTYTLRFTESNLVVTENNQPFARLSFPVELGKSWNGNAFNSQPIQQYEYVLPVQPLSQMEFTGVVQVQLSDIEQNLVNQDQRYHLYAEGVGLIEKNYIRINFSTSGENLGEIESGRILKQYIKEYGKN